MEYKVTIHEWPDYDDPAITGCQIVRDAQNHTIFSVHNLAGCPEDAIISRDLFEAHDFIAAVRFGMKLASQGYTDIVADIIEEGDEF